MLSADDAKDLIVPLGIFPSGDEPKDVYEKILDIIKDKPFADKNAHKLYSWEFHGFGKKSLIANVTDSKLTFIPSGCSCGSQG
jgi:hypothetical protein